MVTPRVRWTGPAISAHPASVLTYPARLAVDVALTLAFGPAEDTTRPNTDPRPSARLEN